MFSFLKRQEEESPPRVGHLSSDEVTEIGIDSPNETKYWHSEINKLHEEINKADNDQIIELLNYKIHLIVEYMREGDIKIALQKNIVIKINNVDSLGDTFSIFVELIKI